MPFKRPKHEDSYRFKHKSYTGPSRPPPASSCIALKKVVHSEKDCLFSLPEFESLNHFLASQIISEAHSIVDSYKNIEKSGFCGWSNVEKKVMTSDASFSRCEASKSRKMHRSVRSRLISSERWSSPPTAQARPLTAQSASACCEKAKVVIHSHTDRFIDDYREGKLKNLRELRHAIIPQR
ncbi:hypothetical protein TcWFU_007078 [Taenia crassiceps]|uniref:Uncharacterized protein n=1 Tax=Taenia crassiceps TaxID=6207 RepID=A0ABR4QS11_9CEST